VTILSDKINLALKNIIAVFKGWLKPNAPSQAHLRGTESRHTKPTLQKSLPCSKAQATP
jgi:hypothetical protein